MGKIHTSAEKKRNGDRKYVEWQNGRKHTKCTKTVKTWLNLRQRMTGRTLQLGFRLNLVGDKQGTAKKVDLTGAGKERDFAELVMWWVVYVGGVVIFCFVCHRKSGLTVLLAEDRLEKSFFLFFSGRWRIN